MRQTSQAAPALALPAVLVSPPGGLVPIGVIRKQDHESRAPPLSGWTVSRALGHPLPGLRLHDVPTWNGRRYRCADVVLP